MFGYATDETEECMPLTIILAHKLNARMAELRRSGVLPWLRPDSKTQVGLSFDWFQTHTLPAPHPLIPVEAKMCSLDTKNCGFLQRVFI